MCSDKHTQFERSKSSKSAAQPPMGGIDLITLQGKIKVDPEGYADEFAQQLKHYEACLAVFLLKPTDSDEQLAELATFIAQVAYCYRQQTAEFTTGIMELLEKQGPLLNPELRLSLVKALILLRHRNQVAATQTLPLFFKLFRCKDKLLRQLCFRHIVADIKNSNKKHVNEGLNRQLQAFLYGVLADDNARAAKKSLSVLCELYRRRVWRDVKTVNVIATAVFHKDVSVMLPAIKFFLGQDEVEEDESDNDNDDDKPVAPSKEELYKAYKKGTLSSKKKKQAKLKRALHTLKKASKGEEHAKRESFAALQLLHDPQAFCEKLFAKVQSGHIRYETRLLLLTLLSRIVGMHKALLLNLYPYLQKYIRPHQPDVHTVLAALVQGCHELVPPEVLSPVLRHVCNQFVHDAARPEAITSGLKTVRELCLRCPLVMTPDLLQDLVGYKKYRNKVVSSTARSLMGLFRELAPGMLEKRDRGRGADTSMHLKEYGEMHVATRVQGAELLEEDLVRGGDGGDLSDSDELSSSDDDEEESDSGDSEAADAEAQQAGSSSDDEAPDTDTSGADSEDDSVDPDVEGVEVVESDEGDEVVGAEGMARNPFASNEDAAPACNSGAGAAADQGGPSTSDKQLEVDYGRDIGSGEDGRMDSAVTLAAQATGKKRKALENDPESLASLKKRLADARQPAQPSLLDDEQLPIEYSRILTEEDFERIRELRHQKLVEGALAKHGLKSAKSSAHKRDRIQQAAEEEAEEMMQFQDGLSTIHEQRVTQDDIIANMKWRRDKEARMASVLAGREDREEYGAAAKRKKTKAGGTSNREKQKQKVLPGVARMAQIRKRKGGGRGGAKNFQGRVCHRFRPKKK